MTISGNPQLKKVFQYGSIGGAVMGDDNKYGEGVLFGESCQTGRGSGDVPVGRVSMGDPIIGKGANWRFKKLDMPLFDGSSPNGWTLRAE